MTRIELRDARLSFDERTLWSGLDLDVSDGEFIAVLGPNGSGKTSLLKVLLGVQRLSAGVVRVNGAVVGEQAPSAVGYVPQQGVSSAPSSLRGIDLVGFGLDGHRYGLGLRGRQERRRKVDAAIDAVGATAYQHQPFVRLSGGEQQRLRVAQALVGDPAVLLCDEPLMSLDLAHQRQISELIDGRRRTADTPVLFVTHEINPILSYVDRVLYLVDGRFAIGTPEEVMTSQTLSQLYRTPVQVVDVGGQLHVVGSHSELCEGEPHHTTQQV